uniref:Uncharacterized protein n=1 Tax=Octopus bimaculoides TaxID=37653 RepID=A0A0L8IEI4_OCTBM
MKEIVNLWSEIVYIISNYQMPVFRQESLYMYNPHWPTGRFIKQGMTQTSSPQSLLLKFNK